MTENNNRQAKTRANKRRYYPPAKPAQNEAAANHAQNGQQGADRTGAPKVIQAPPPKPRTSAKPPQSGAQPAPGRQTPPQSKPKNSRSGGSRAPRQ